MKKLFLTSALVIAAATSVTSNAWAVEAPSLGDRIKQNWDQNVDRNGWMEPVKHEPAFPAAADDRVKARDDAAMPHHGKHHHGKKAESTKATPEAKAEHKAEHKAKMAKMTPEEKAKIKADRKAKWDAMTPEQKAAWKAKHAAKKAAGAPVANTTTATPAAAQ